MDRIKSWFTGKNGFDEHSPSKWSNGVAKYVMQGMADGFENGLPSLMDSVGGVTDRIKNGLDFGTASIDYAQTQLLAELYKTLNDAQKQEVCNMIDTLLSQQLKDQQSLDSHSAATENQDSIA